MTQPSFHLPLSRPMLLQSHAEDNGHLLLGMSEATIAPKKSVYLYRQSLDTCRNTATKNTPTRINPPTLTVANRFDTDDDRLQESGHGQIVSGKRGPAYDLDK